MSKLLAVVMLIAIIAVLGISLYIFSDYVMAKTSNIPEAEVQIDMDITGAGDEYATLSIKNVGTVGIREVNVSVYGSGISETTSIPENTSNTTVMVIDNQYKDPWILVNTSTYTSSNTSVNTLISQNWEIYGVDIENLSDIYGDYYMITGSDLWVWIPYGARGGDPTDLKYYPFGTYVFISAYNDSTTVHISDLGLDTDNWTQTFTLNKDEYKRINPYDFVYVPPSSPSPKPYELIGEAWHISTDNPDKPVTAVIGWTGWTDGGNHGYEEVQGVNSTKYSFVAPGNNSIIIIQAQENNTHVVLDNLNTTGIDYPDIMLSEGDYNETTWQYNNSYTWTHDTDWGDNLSPDANTTSTVYYTPFNITSNKPIEVLVISMGNSGGKYGITMYDYNYSYINTDYTNFIELTSNTYIQFNLYVKMSGGWTLFAPSYEPLTLFSGYVMKIPTQGVYTAFNISSRTNLAAKGYAITGYSDGITRIPWRKLNPYPLPATRIWIFPQLKYTIPVWGGYINQWTLEHFTTTTTKQYNDNGFIWYEDNTTMTNTTILIYNETYIPTKKYLIENISGFNLLPGHVKTWVFTPNKKIAENAIITVTVKFADGSIKTYEVTANVNRIS